MSDLQSCYPELLAHVHSAPAKPGVRCQLPRRERGRGVLDLNMREKVEAEGIVNSVILVVLGMMLSNAPIIEGEQQLIGCILGSVIPGA